MPFPCKGGHRSPYQERSYSSVVRNYLEDERLPQTPEVDAPNTLSIKVMAFANSWQPGAYVF